jgi:hypothetical protein
MPFIPKNTEPTKTIAFRLPHDLSRLYDQVRELCEQHHGRLDLMPVVLPVIEAELKAVKKKLAAPAAVATGLTSSVGDS